jgi:integrase/recombinase XerD
MGSERKVIQFPGTRERVRNRPSRKVKSIDGFKYFSQQQIKLLRRTVRDQATLDQAGGQVTAVREWMAIDLLTSTGLRVSEAAT